MRELDRKKLPIVKGTLPGPLGSELLARDQRVLSPSYTRDYPMVAERGEGMWVLDPDGNRFLDMAAGIAVCSTGHCHPRVVKAIQDQAAKLIHLSGTDYYYQPEVELAERLARLQPVVGSEPRVFFTNSGTEAIEGAIKLARYATARQQLIAFYGGFHGRSLGALALTASKPVQRRGFSPVLPSVHHSHFAYCYRCVLNQHYPECHIKCAQYIEDVLFQTLLAADEVAAIVVEPVQGEGGYIVPPIEFIRELRAIADRYGILLIADEIQSGAGRTGKMFAMEHFGVKPDVTVLAKGIASGMPLGAIIADTSVMKWPAGSHGTTFGGNPVSCAAAVATLDLIENGLLANAARMGDYLIDGLRELMTRHPLIGDVRGLGLMIGVELVKNRETREPAIAERNALVHRCYEKGMLTLRCGGSVVRLCPALVISSDEASVALTILDEALSEVEAEASITRH